MNEAKNFDKALSDYNEAIWLNPNFALGAREQQSRRHSSDPASACSRSPASFCRPPSARCRRVRIDDFLAYRQLKNAFQLPGSQRPAERLPRLPETTLAAEATGRLEQPRAVGKKRPPARYAFFVGVSGAVSRLTHGSVRLQQKGLGYDQNFEAIRGQSASESRSFAAARDIQPKS
jgi:hypothetical protein